MQQFVHDPLDRSLDLLTVLFIQVRQFVEQSVQLVLADGMPILHQARNDLATRAMIILGHEFGRLFVDQLSRLVDFSDTRLAVRLARLFQTVDVVEKDIVQVSHIGVEVAGGS